MSGLTFQNIPDLWNNNVPRFPNKTAVIYEGRSWTFRELDHLIGQMANALRDRFEVKKGDRLAMLMPNCFEYCVAYWAALKNGAVVVPINVRLRADGVQRTLENTDAALLFVHQENWEVGQEALENTSLVKQVVSVGFAQEGLVPYDELLTGSSDFDDTPVAEDDLAIIMHTSGTTGVPKGAMMTHGDLLFNVKNTIIAHGFRHEDVHMLVVPMFHCTALYSVLPTSAYLGSSFVVAPRTDIRELVTLIQDHKITAFIGVPTLFYFLTTFKDLDQYDLSSLKLIAYAGSMMPPQTIRRLREKFPNVELRNFFGMTETISVTHVLPSEDALSHAESIGKLLPDVAAKVIDDDGNEAGPGVVGELCFRKENVIGDYWGRPGLLQESMVDDWFRTGDYAMVDEDGYFYLRGRKKEMIIVGGENVYALEVENRILANEKVMEVAVVGVPATGARAYLGELVKAVVVPKAGQELKELEVKRHCAEIFPSYKVPQIVEFRDKLPRNPSGKVLKRELVDPGR